MLNVDKNMGDFLRKTRLPSPQTNQADLYSLKRSLETICMELE